MTHILMYRRPEWIQPWVVASSLEFEINDVICCFPVKYPKLFARTFGACIQTLTFNLKRQQIVNFVYTFGALKNAISIKGGLPPTPRFPNIEQ